MVRKLVVLLLCGLFAVSAFAQQAPPTPKPDTPAQAAEKALTAIAANDDAALKAVAGRDEPDPWLVADELLFLGKHDAAEAFARAAPRKDVEALPAYVAKRRTVPYDRAARAALLEANARLDEGKAAESLAACDRARAAEDDLMSVRLKGARASALIDLGRIPEGLDATEESAAAARRLGWCTRETQGWARAATRARNAGAFDRALAANDRQLASAHERSSAIALGEAFVDRGLLFREAKRFDEALDAFREARRVHDECGFRIGVAWAEQQMGLLHVARGQRDEAISSFRRALELFDGAGDRGGSAKAASQLGSQLLESGDAAAALPVLERACPLMEETLPSRHRIVLPELWVRLGNAADTAGKGDRALLAYARGAELAAGMGRPREEMRAYVGMAQVRIRREQREAAIENLQRALAIAESLGDARMTALLLEDIGMQRLLHLQPEGAYAPLRRALDLEEKSGEPVRVRQVLRRLAVAALESGRLAEAESLATREVALDEASGNRTLLALSLETLGSAQLGRGRPADALIASRRALELYIALKMPGVGFRARFDVAVAYQSLGESEVALRSLMELASDPAVASEPVLLVPVLVHASRLYVAKGDLDRAAETARTALAAAERSRSPRMIAAATTNLAQAHLARSAPDEAASVIERWLAAASTPAAPHDHAFVSALAALATARLSGGAPSKAREAAQRALEASSGNCAGCEASALDALAQVADREGRDAEACELRRRAIHAADRASSFEPLRAALARTLVVGDLQRGKQWTESVVLAKETVELLGRIVRTQSEDAGIGQREQIAPIFKLGFEGARRCDDLSSAAFFLEAGRAGLLLDALGQRQAAASATISPALLAEERGGRERLAEAVRAARVAEDGTDPDALAAARRAADAARDAWTDIVARIQHDSRNAADVAFPQPDSLEAIRSRLRKGEALVLYHVPGCLCHEAAALVVVPSGGRIVPLGPCADLTAACAALTAPDGTTDVAPAVADLRKRLVEPLALGDDVARVLVSPDALSSLPFALLFGERDLVYVPSGTTYGVLLAEAGRRGEGVLALGDPDYGRGPAADPVGVAEVRRGALKLVPLPATGAEAKAVGDTVLLGKEASPTGLREALAKRPRWRSVHLACHGMLDLERPAMSALALSATGADDGFLTALDVIRWKVPSDLVVLSACETGGGRFRAAEGVIGLTRAFMVAGAPRVLVSNWNVDDEATLAFMKAFYASWNSGKPAARSVRDAMASVRAVEKWKHPRYWAAWSLWGLGD